MVLLFTVEKGLRRKLTIRGVINHFGQDKMRGNNKGIMKVINKQIESNNTSIIHKDIRLH